MMQRLSRRSLCVASHALSQGQRSIVTLPKLDYAYDALEPVISAEIMELHHAKHHQTYIDNLNTLTKKLDSVTDLAQRIDIQSGIKFNGGGHVNHSIFWTNLAPASSGGGGEPDGALRKCIDTEFNSFQQFKEKFLAKSVALQGSGWVWLGYNRETGHIQLATTSNQDVVLSQGITPLLCVDVWEHAYYLQYKNKRADYVKAIFDIVNWGNVSERFTAASK